MTSPRRLIASRFPVRLLGPALATLLHQWQRAANAEPSGVLSADTTTITGTIRQVRQGTLQPGVLVVDVDGIEWQVHIGAPWRTQRAGLTLQQLAPGLVVSVVGRTQGDGSSPRLRADQLLIEGRAFDLVSPPH